MFQKAFVYLPVKCRISRLALNQLFFWGFWRFGSRLSFLLFLRLDDHVIILAIVGALCPEPPSLEGEDTGKGDTADEVVGG